VSPSVTDVTVHVAPSGTAATVVGIVVGIVVGVVLGVGSVTADVVETADASVDGRGDVVDVARGAVVTTAVVDDGTAVADVSAVVESGADDRGGSATAAPPPDPSPSASAPTTPTLVSTTLAHAQNGTRRQRRFHHGTVASPEGSDAGGRKGESLTAHRRCGGKPPGAGTRSSEALVDQ
jgi:hypothetical protein